MIIKSILLASTILLAGCATPTAQHAPTKSLITGASPLVDLVQSTQIIRALINSNQLDTLLEAHDPAQLALLLNNFSPAQMAFETEVKATDYPLVVSYYYQPNTQSREFLTQLAQLATQYHDQIKFVVIDSEQLFTLAQAAEITTFPTTILSRQGVPLQQLTGELTIAELQTTISITTDHL